MENKKAKNLIIAILIVLLLVCLGVVVWQYLKINNTTSNQEEVMGENNNTPTYQENVDSSQNNTQPEDKEENRDPEMNKTEKEENKFDPYANYKDFTWGNTKYLVSNNNNDKTGIEIKNNEVYLTFENKTVQVKNISGTPKKVMGAFNGGIIYYYLLTEEGKIYWVEWSDTTATAELAINLNKYNIIDFTSGNGKSIVRRVIYYLTADGKLIDQNGDTFEALNKNFVDSFGSLGHVIYIDSDNYIYFSKNGDANYTIIKDTSGNKVKARELYLRDGIEGEEIIIITQDNQIISVRNDGKITQEKGKIKLINTYNEDNNGTMIVKMDNNKQVFKYNLRTSYYNITKSETIEMKEKISIESIQMYKRNEQSSEKYYTKSMNLTKEQIERVKDVLGELEYVGNSTLDTNKDTYKVVIKYKEGEEIVLYVYPASGVVIEDVLYLLEGQIIETFDSISYKYSWE